MRLLALLGLLMISNAAIAEDKPAVSIVPTIGSPAPAFEVVDTNGTVIGTDLLKGKVIVLEWKNHQCPFTRKHYKTGNMQSLQQAAKDKDIVWVSIISSAKGKQGHVSADEANLIAEEEKSVAAHIVLDESGELGQLYKAKTTPHMYIIDEQGMLVYMGAIDDISTADPDDIVNATNYVTATLDALEAGKTPEVSVTSPYGCSVKYDY